MAYLALSGLLWGLIGCGLLWGLWRRRAWTPWALRLAVLAYALYYWLDRLWLAEAGPQNANRPFALFMTGVVLAWIFASFSLARVRAYFGVEDERTE